MIKKLLRYPVTPLRRNCAGQATSEMVILLPLFVVLIGGVISIGYMCWQGIKVQQAANMAARIQGQERVGGGATGTDINIENGITGEGDELPEVDENGRFRGDVRNLHLAQDGSIPGVYGNFRRVVRGMFNGGEKERLYIPPPKTGANSDAVKVVRVLNPPKIFWLKLKPVVLEATAYGGEDTRMYGLPRWGKTGEDRNNSFYKSQIQE